MTITVKAGPGGRVVPSGAVKVAKGTKSVFKVAASAGWRIHHVTGCGGTLAGEVYTTGRATSDCVVSASFSLEAPRLSVVRINNDAATTAWPSVTLNHTVSATSASPTEYRASESPNWAGAIWRPYASAPRFELSSARGTKTVYLQLRAGQAHASNVLSDTIEFRGNQAYSVPAREFYAAARNTGFVSSAVARRDIPCRCSILEGPANGVEASEVAGWVVCDHGEGGSQGLPACELLFFDQGVLKNEFVFQGTGWTKVPGDTCGASQDRYQEGSTSPFQKFRVWIEPPECKVVLNSIVLRGPAESDWHAALGGKP
ncbi:MAG: hypothetical protein ACOY3Y_04530 [Acidobacteriota bacterium]